MATALDTSVKAHAVALGADFFGVADLAPARAAILDQGGPAIAEFPRAISIGIALPNSIIDMLPQRVDPTVAKLFRAHAYDRINSRLDEIISRLSSLLQNRGYRTLPVPATGVVHGDFCGIFSNKMAAHLAGLGWIGQSCLLITPEVGPRARWGAVLTDAPLEPAGQMMPPRCGDCHACVDACPPKAILGRPFRPEEHRDVRFSAQKCNEYMLEAEKKVGVRLCGMCVFICPQGRKSGKPAGRR